MGALCIVHEIFAVCGVREYVPTVAGSPLPLRAESIVGLQFQFQIRTRQFQMVLRTIDILLY